MLAVIICAPHGRTTHLICDRDRIPEGGLTVYVIGLQTAQILVYSYNRAALVFRRGQRI